LSPAAPLKFGSILMRLAILVAAFVFLYLFFGLCLPKIRSSPRVEVILPDEPQRSMGLRTLLESGEPNSL
jgi:hypothetical protein